MAAASVVFLGLDLKHRKLEKLARHSQTRPFTHRVLLVLWNKSLISNSCRRCTRDFQRLQVDGRSKTARGIRGVSQPGLRPAGRNAPAVPPDPPHLPQPVPKPLPPPSLQTSRLEVFWVDGRPEPQRQ